MRKCTLPLNRKSMVLQEGKTRFSVPSPQVIALLKSQLTVTNSLIHGLETQASGSEITVGFI